ncbi:DUF6311 domain-containing protein [Polynucleobacter sp.]|uniref:DUF6311 domain-containing protein n=1 Tax=Polynucleobacter sp. TaxID=2029855 RepID=UPI0025CD00E6|nr:DUF6311 domain-containing protein [Polynucleobacter sp.]
MSVSWGLGSFPFSLSANDFVALSVEDNADMSKMIKFQKNHSSNLIPIVMGIAAFIAVVGLAILNPRNVSWLLADFDMTLEYLGWAFYRYGPWTFPIGLNPNFGLDISSSIIYSNSMPLFAMVFKPFSSNLGEPFQFWGIWILLCFVLQAYMAWLLMGLITKDLWIMILATGLLLFSPPMFSQIGFHNSTIGHFPILAALYLILRPQQNKRIFWWSLLLPCTLMIHPYTFAMLVALWLADLMDKLFLQKKLNFWQVLIEVVCAVTTTFLIAWQAGYFMSVSPGETGFGMYRMNLLAIFDPSGFDAANWSYFYSLPWVRSNNNYEGFVYLGLGLIVVLFIAMPMMAKHRDRLKRLLQKHVFIVLCLICLTLFALSNNVGIGPWTLSIPLSEKLFAIASILRASARMFWPVFYVIALCTIYFLVRGYSKKVAITVLGIALTAQIMDTSSAWLEIKHKINHPGPQPVSSLSDPFWTSAAKHYKNVVRVPVWNEQVIWEKFANYAAQNQMGTNSVFMGRVNQQKIEQANLKMKEVLRMRTFDPQTLYIVEDNYVPQFIQAMNPKTDLLARFNEINVFAPGWYDCKGCIKIDEIAKINPSISNDRLTRIGERIDLSRFGKYSKTYLGQGWSVPENWGVWSLNKNASLTLPLPAKNPQKLIIETQVFIGGAQKAQEVEVWVNGVLQKKATLTERFGNEIVVPLPSVVANSKQLKLDFVFPTAISPKALGIGIDERPLALGLEAIRYE